MTTALVVIVAIGLVLGVTAMRAARHVPRGHVAVVERFGRYRGPAGPGVVFLAPVVDRIRVFVDMRERELRLERVPFRTADGGGVEVDGVLHYRVIDARAAAYEVADVDVGVEQLVVTVGRAVLGARDQGEALVAHTALEAALGRDLGAAVLRWGLRLVDVRVAGIAREGTGTRRPAVRKDPHR
jgi:regulator of protease activity HflC (stomatin/prohibitin superfamily)